MSMITIYEFAGMPVIGDMPVPADFPHLDILLKGRPRHEALSDFRRKHPRMSCARRAKLFAPFDALAGFDERIAGKEVLYEERKTLSDSEQENLDEKLSVLHSMCHQRKNRQRTAPRVTVTYFSPCTDTESDSYGSGGNYINYTGHVLKIDLSVKKAVTIDDLVIPISDICNLEINQYGK